MDGYKRRTEKKKEYIQQAALELFMIYGIEKVSIAEIAKKANVSPVTIYNYFGSKEELFKEVLSDYMDKELETYKQLLQVDIPFPKKLEKMIFDKKETAKTLSLDFLKGISDPSLKNIIDDFANNKAIPLIMELIEQGRTEGYVNANMSTDAILIYIQTFSELTHRTELFSNYNMDILLDLGNLFFYGLLGQPVNEERVQ
ncbi:TetR/AcrR family transcriptional regulator [Heyndrickxia sporothermodurans]|uniref:TetR/AcrR family transcriptional regulator n=1 Tax=Heyndrickxia vini TaxID=1476025 RepID=A0ABX7E3A6_9BACI|nr:MULTISPECIES: TetR/AcrR family transcriptional regulator [Heyndrickxia]MEB6550956.1 TetR/AcrR family transcriptional regulator [Heyndrickxia sporothermodurans]QQZ09731.1 TetR/AcrR family transcriptional regulator [Heyndrickxia vini]